MQNPRDLTDALLKAKKEAEEEDSTVKGFLTDEHLTLTMSEVLIAGMETTTSTVPVLDFAIPDSQPERPRHAASRTR